MIKIIVFILCMAVSMCIGAGIATMIYHPDMRTARYNIGMVSFCQLIEADRLKVCPVMRVSLEHKDGGTITSYVCDNRRVFIETNNFHNPVDKLLNVYKAMGRKVVSKCETEFGDIYELVKP